MHAGEDVTVRAGGDGQLSTAALGSRIRRHAGIASGIYEDGEVRRLRDEWDR